MKRIIRNNLMYVKLNDLVIFNYIAKLPDQFALCIMLFVADASYP